jgi:hypothetical protein
MGLFDQRQIIIFSSRNKNFGRRTLSSLCICITTHRKNQELHGNCPTNVHVDQCEKRAYNETKICIEYRFNQAPRFIFTLLSRSMRLHVCIIRAIPCEIFRIMRSLLTACGTDSIKKYNKSKSRCGFLASLSMPKRIRMNRFSMHPIL